ncbi:13452_t:CDS:2, partial [Gigaspora margarita]
NNSNSGKQIKVVMTNASDGLHAWPCLPYEKGKNFKYNNMKIRSRVDSWDIGGITDRLVITGSLGYATLAS